MKPLAEAITLAVCALLVVHAQRRHGRRGLEFAAGLLLLGALRENAVAIVRMLYEYEHSDWMFGAAPLIAVCIWWLAVYCSRAFAEIIVPEKKLALQLAAIALFMVALAFFFEPLLTSFGMARWEAGTKMVQGTPRIALIGYTTLAVAYCWGFAWISRIDRATPRLIAIGLFVAALAPAHAFGLRTLKATLGW